MYGQEVLTLIDEVRKMDESDYPEVLPLPYRSLSSEVQAQLEAAIMQHSQYLAVGENILMRKKWLSELYAFTVADTKPKLSPWLSGWRKEWVFASLVPILQAVTLQATPPTP